MALNLSFNITVSDDMKYLLIHDTSTGYEDARTYILNQILISTELADLWEDPITNKVIINPVDINTGDTITDWTNGVQMQIPASSIFSDNSAFIYDNIYTVHVDLDDDLNNVISSSTKSLFYPLSQWYKNNVVSLYNYYEEDMDQMRTIITYQTWLFSLRTASQYADDGTISVILKSFKRLIDGYGLPG